MAPIETNTRKEQFSVTWLFANIFDRVLSPVYLPFSVGPWLKQSPIFSYASSELTADFNSYCPKWSNVGLNRLQVFLVADLAKKHAGYLAHVFFSALTLLWWQIRTWRGIASWIGGYLSWRIAATRAPSNKFVLNIIELAFILHWMLSRVKNNHLDTRGGFNLPRLKRFCQSMDAGTAIVTQFRAQLMQGPGGVAGGGKG